MPLLVFKTSGGPKRSTVGSTPTRLRHPSPNPQENLNQSCVDNKLHGISEGEQTATKNDQEEHRSSAYSSRGADP